MKKSNKKSTSNKANRNWLTGSVIVVASVVSIAVVAVVFFQAKESERVLGVGDKIVSRSEYNQRMEQAKKYGDDESKARSALIENLKNRQVAKELNIPIIKEALSEQAAGLVSAKTETIEGRAWAETLSYNQYISNFVASGMTGKVYFGSYFHFPYFPDGRQYVEDIAKPARESLEDSRESLSGDVALMKELRTELPLESASMSGLYMFDDYGSGLLFGGPFGVRPGLLPTELLNEVTSGSHPSVSKLHHIPDDAYYFTHITASYDMGDDFATRFENIKDKIRVVEYDR